jgi:hypothetical protein
MSHLKVTVTDCYVVIRRVFSFQISAVHIHNSLTFIRTDILLSNCRFIDNDLVQQRVPVDDDGACRILGYVSCVLLVVTLCRWVKIGVVSKDPNAFFVRVRQPKKNLWGF